MRGAVALALLALVAGGCGGSSARHDRGRAATVLYLLHGCCDTYESWTRSTRIESWPELRGVLVVMPEGGDVGFRTVEPLVLRESRAFVGRLRRRALPTLLGTAPTIFGRCLAPPTPTIRSRSPSMKAGSGPGKRPVEPVTAGGC